MVELALFCFLLETRTRFKEDCDRELNAPRVGLGIEVGNQDSLQRGLRPFSADVAMLVELVERWKPGLASKRIAT